MKERREELLVMPDLIGMLFPHKVYQIHGNKGCEIGLRMLVAGFRELEDAEFFLNMMKQKYGDRYVIESVERVVEPDDNEDDDE